MEIVLLENIKKLGKIGDTVKVKDGYGRNFLIKHGKALKASKENLTLVNKKKEELDEKNVTLKNNAKKIFDIINNKSYKFSKEAKENNELFGTIKPKELSMAIENVDKLQVKPSQIDFTKQIDKIGSYDVVINLHSDIQAKVHIEVVKEKQDK
tara:strand:- start:2528 stop:2986 length:459 start_codon:yes stop_codon:yes gene_type:complete